MGRYYDDGAASGQFAAMMFKLANSIPSARITEAQVREYAQLLDDVPEDRLAAAFLRAARDNDGFYPSAAKLRRLAGVPSEADAALVAWTGLSRACEEVGGYASIEVEDRAAALALLEVFGSWSGFCAVDEGPELALKRQEFLAAYRRHVPGRDWTPVRLAGSIEADGRSARGALAAHTWAARLTLSGRIVSERERPQLEAGRGQRAAALPEGRVTKDDQGAAEARGRDAGQGGQADRRGARRLLPTAGKSARPVQRQE